MKRRVLLVPVLMLLAVSAAFAQGLETFDGVEATTSTSYGDGTFTGQDGSTWTFVQCRRDDSITGQALMIGRNRDPQSYFQSGTLTGGIATMNFDYKQAFSTNVNLKILVNDIEVATVTSSSEQGVVKNSGDIIVNVSGNFVMKFINVNTGDGQVTIDNIAWTAFSPDTPYPPTARAGQDQFVLYGETVTLDGSASSDPNDDIETYLWTQLSGASVTLSNSGAVTTTFTAPSVDANLSFELLVTDSTGLFDRDTVYVTVRESILNTVFFSEYIEGSSNNKALEIYNGSGATVNLNNFRIAQSNDGGGWQYYHTFPDGATLADSDVWVILNSSTSTSLFNHADADELLDYPSVVHHNGNDARGLQWTPDGGTTWVMVDVIGDHTSAADFNVAGITGAGKDHTLIRKPHISVGNPDWASSAGTNEENSEWIVMDIDYFGNLGSHTTGALAYTYSNMSLNTDFPRAGSEIGVSIDITPGDDVPAATGVKIWYGTGGTLANSSDMWLESGNNWAGTIPSLSSGNLLLEYYVEAKNGSFSSKSTTYRTIVAGTTTPISDIHANLASVTGQIKTLEGVVTIGSNIITTTYTSAYMQDASGRGLNIYRAGTPVIADLERGTKIRIVGEIELYNTTVEITNFKYQILATDEELPAPLAVSVAGANSDNLEGTLATVTGELTRIDTFTTSKNLILGDGSAETVIKVYNSTGIDLSVLSTGTEYAFTGVGTKFNTEHQLLVAYQTDISDEVGICDRDLLPASFALHAAYPNPFNPATTVEYTLDRTGSYTLSVYNLTGQRVAVLSSGYAEPGYYKQTWNAGAFTSGIYFIRLEAAGHVATRKVVLIK